MVNEVVVIAPAFTLDQFQRQFLIADVASNVLCLVVDIFGWTIINGFREIVEGCHVVSCRQNTFDDVVLHESYITRHQHLSHNSNWYGDLFKFIPICGLFGR